jgi:Chaperone of endosialidase
MSVNYSIPNYSGKQPNNSASIKNFVAGSPPILWKTITYNGTFGAITPASNNYNNLYIPGNLYVDGNIINPSDINIKEDITNITTDVSDSILNLNPKQFFLKDDSEKKLHYGFIAQDFENYFPDLIDIKPDKDKNKKIKAINYLEIIPLLVHKIQNMQKEIDILKQNQNNDPK